MFELSCLIANNLRLICGRFIGVVLNPLELKKYRIYSMIKTTEVCNEMKREASKKGNTVYKQLQRLCTMQKYFSIFNVDVPNWV